MRERARKNCEQPPVAHSYYDNNNLTPPHRGRSKDAHQPLQRFGQPTPALEVAGLLGQPQKQMPEALGRDREKPPVGWDAHDRLGHAQRDDLRVCDPPGGVVLPFGQEIVGGAEHRREQQVEVGVHPGPHRSAMRISTADFDPAARKSSTNTAPPWNRSSRRPLK